MDKTSCGLKTDASNAYKMNNFRLSENHSFWYHLKHR